MSEKRVVFVNRFFYPDLSATSQILSDLVFDLARDGFEVEVVTSRHRYEQPGAKLPSFEAILRPGSARRVHTHRVWSTQWGRRNLLGKAIDYITFCLFACLKLWRRLDSNAVVVIKTDPPLLSVVAAPVGWLSGARVVNWLQDLFPEVAESLGVPGTKGALMTVARRARNATLRRATLNVVLGTRMAARLTAEGVPLQLIRLIPNWADGNEITPLKPEENPLRSDWGLQGNFVVGYSGNLGRAHEFLTFLRAAECLSDQENIRFLFIGAGAQRAVAEEEVQARKLRNVLFKPYQPRENLRQSLCAADVHLVSLNPALEGLIVPSKFYGIAAAGRPTLFVGDCNGEIPQVLREAGCGYSFAVSDSDGLAAMIRRLATDAAACADLGRNARRVFEERFERAKSVQAWKEVLALPQLAPGELHAVAGDR